VLRGQRRRANDRRILHQQLNLGKRPERPQRNGD
jgi:hypothetical protein